MASAQINAADATVLYDKSLIFFFEPLSRLSSILSRCEKEICMNANNKRGSEARSPSEHHAPLKGSDFFPPGAGWNRAKNPDENARPFPGEKRPATHDKH